MRFVKASERLPDDTKRPVPPPQVIVRWMYLGEYPRIDLMTPNQLADLVKNNVDPDYYEWLDESEQDEGWVPVEDNNFPFDVSIIIEHNLGYDAVRLDKDGWKFWYAGQLVPEEIITNIIKTAKKYLVGNGCRPPATT